MTVWLPLQVVGTTRVPSDQSRVAAFPPPSVQHSPVFHPLRNHPLFASPLSHIAYFAMGYGTTPDDVINNDELIPPSPASGLVTSPFVAVAFVCFCLFLSVLVCSCLFVCLLTTSENGPRCSPTMMFARPWFVACVARLSSSADTLLLLLLLLLPSLLLCSHKEQNSIGKRSGPCWSWTAGRKRFH